MVFLIEKMDSKNFRQVLKQTFIKFTSRTFFLSAVWVFVAVFILIRDGEAENQPAALMCIGCAVATTLVYCITRSREKQFKIKFGNLEFTAEDSSNHK
jgi:preprotein translocase subunit SecF